MRAHLLHQRDTYNIWGLNTALGGLIGVESAFFGASTHNYVAVDKISGN